jgi:hypothetical protein
MALRDDVRERSGRIACGACIVAMTATIGSVQLAAASDSPPLLVVSPSANLHDGESISVSVGANGYFTPDAHVNILECADPGGSVANLPKNIDTCDGNTIQGNTVLIASNGSFSEPDYTVYQLPSSILGEQSNSQPVCNQANPCVLYIGQNQNDFTAPKEFSAPFSIAPSTGSTTTSVPVAPTSTVAPTTGSGSANSNTTTTTTTTTATTTPTTVGPTVTTASPTTLAQTGVPSGVAWIAVIGGGLSAVGSLGRRFVLKVRP